MKQVFMQKASFHWKFHPMQWLLCLCNSTVYEVVVSNLARSSHIYAGKECRNARMLICKWTLNNARWPKLIQWQTSLIALSVGITNFWLQQKVTWRILSISPWTNSAAVHSCKDNAVMVYAMISPTPEAWAWFLSRRSWWLGLSGKPRLKGWV